MVIKYYHFCYCKDCAIRLDKCTICKSNIDSLVELKL